MLSQIVTAARGLFKRPDGTEDTASEQEQPANMATATRNSTLSPETPETQGAPVSNGKRKETSSSSVTETTENRPQKRRKGQTSLKTTKSKDTTKREGDGAKPKNLQVLESVTIINRPNTNSTSAAPENEDIVAPNRKIRFGSEEPAQTNGTHVDDDEGDVGAESEHGTTRQPNNEDDEDDSSDDEAPEAFSNAAQLSQIRDVERKKEETRHMDEQLRREKRKEHEKRLQQQAASKAAIQRAADARREAKAKIAEAKTSKHDEQQSESSMTLSAGTRESRLGLSAPLPALLPDEILNAEPSQPLITAFDMEKLKMGKPKHIRLTDAVDKRPKDMKVGSTAIRVLNSSGNGVNPVLPPKSSTASRHVKENWVGGKRKMGATGALRHSTGGPKSFARK
ncbi:hypothetical protein MGYG_02450 [Nannizzia gypsea CBS 118893]|uniref:Immediate-early protein n=1 Tax=Arthroderma gypseum (strain ATCC MYA-4604 / CBS 118893) TaxID=535722 RepID=E4UMM1_ARTGP|nr:hypothetical protein MGYG_02450 [Nannizzia gypsea CBS 118893]EFQ99438.1 hypothetical protein MGYG_02450 [Nannizzia gypsea CBS 118893]